MTNPTKADHRWRIVAPPRRVAIAAFAAAALTTATAQAMDQSGSGAAMDHSDISATTGQTVTTDQGGAGMPGLHIPAGVTGAFMVPAGEGMINYTPSFMRMSGNYIGSSQVSAATIASSIFSGQTMTKTMMMKSPMGMMMPMTMTMPVMLRVVPSSMETQMHMFNGMYGLTDALNLMFMGNYTQKSMSMTTFAGMTGVGVLGQSSGSTEGVSDAMVGAIYRIYQDSTNHLQFGLSLALPIGNQQATIQMLSPMGMYMNMRAPYAMQIGTGTVDLVPTLAYTGVMGPWSWGLMYRGRFALNYNNEGWQYGASNEITGWGGYSVIPGVTLTARALGATQDHIHGQDISITGLSQNTDPLYYGGKHIDLFGGIEVAGASLGLGMTVFGVEAGGPVFQELNGPQLGRAWQITASGRFMF